MPREILWLLTNDTEFTAGWGKNPSDRSTDLVHPDSIYVQLVTRNRGLAEILDRFGIPENIMLSWGCLRSLEIAAQLARTNGRPAGPWLAAYEEGLTLLAAVLRGGHRVYPHPHYEKDLSCQDPDYRYSATADALERWSKWSNGYYRYRGSLARVPALQRLGSYGEAESRLGYLYAGRRWLADNLRTNGIAARTGGWDFGFNTEDKAVSEEAYRRNGIFVNLDADLNMTMWRNLPSTPKPWSQSAYLAFRGDINQPTTAASDWGLLEIAHCSGLERNNTWYDLNNLTLAELNQQLDTAVATFTVDGETKPGVHVISAMCHSAGFCGGDWDAAAGGEFAKVEAHLDYLSTKYVETGQITPVTIDEAAERHLNCYSSRIVAWPGSESKAGTTWRIPLHVAGGVENENTQLVEVDLPLFTSDSQAFTGWLEMGRELTPIQYLSGPSPRVSFLMKPGLRSRECSLLLTSSGGIEEPGRVEW